MIFTCSSIAALGHDAAEAIASLWDRQQAEMIERHEAVRDLPALCTSGFGHIDVIEPGVCDYCNEHLETEGQ